MSVRCAILLSVLLACTIGSVNAGARDLGSRRFLLDKEGGAIEVQTTQPDDKEARNAIRQQLQEEARKAIPFATPALQRHKKEIKYRYENTLRGGRVRIIAKSRDALTAVQDFLRTHVSNAPQRRAVAFDFIGDTSLVVVPVTINDHGPYRFLLDTGASNTVLSTAVADSLGIPKRRDQILLTAGGNIPVTLRTISTLQVGNATLENVEIAVANFELMSTLSVDGVLGGDYLRRFKISIDYDNRIVEIEPSTPETMSMLVA